jgi:hypothetical protein
MTKKELKELIKEVIVEAQKLTPEEAAYPGNIAAKEIGAALKANPLYKDVKVLYLTSRSEGASGSAFAYLNPLNVDGGGYVFFATHADARNKIRVDVSSYISGSEDRASKEFTNVADAIKFTKNPMSVFKASRNDELKGAEVLSVVDKGKGYGKIITLVTKDGKKITGKFSI